MIQVPGLSADLTGAASLDPSHIRRERRRSLRDGSRPMHSTEKEPKRIPRDPVTTCAGHKQCLAPQDGGPSRSSKTGSDPLDRVPRPSRLPSKDWWVGWRATLGPVCPERWVDETRGPIPGRSNAASARQTAKCAQPDAQGGRSLRHSSGDRRPRARRATPRARRRQSLRHPLAAQTSRTVRRGTADRSGTYRCRRVRPRGSKGHAPPHR